MYLTYVLPGITPFTLNVPFSSPSSTVTFWVLPITHSGSVLPDQRSRVPALRISTVISSPIFKVAFGGLKTNPLGETEVVVSGTVVVVVVVVTAFVWVTSSPFSSVTFMMKSAYPLYMNLTKVLPVERPFTLNVPVSSPFSTDTTSGSPILNSGSSSLSHTLSVPTSMRVTVISSPTDILFFGASNLNAHLHNRVVVTAGVVAQAFS